MALSIALSSVRSRSSTIFSARASYKVDAKTSINLDVFNLFNRKANDIDYYYCSRLPSDNPASRCSDGTTQGFQDIHFHPVEPRTVRLAVVARY